MRRKRSFVRAFASVLLAVGLAGCGSVVVVVQGVGPVPTPATGSPGTSGGSTGTATGLPDLTIVKIEAENTSDGLALHAIVQNKGTAPAAEYEVRWVLDRPGQAALSETTRHKGLAAGEISKREHQSKAIVVPGAATPRGTVTVDPGNAVAETEETNNTMALGPTGGALWTIPVLVVRYFPVAGDRIDINVTGDWGESLSNTRAKTERLTNEVSRALESGSIYRGYTGDGGTPSLKYEVVDTLEYLEPLPTLPRNGQVPLTDYKSIMARIDARKWVQERGVKEIWIWAYHGGVVGLWESNMSSPYGDVSNSDRDPDDLPVFDRTYTVYHYNYQRGPSEATEDHMHQLEALFNNVDRQLATPKEQWPELLFWGKFVGSDHTNKIVRPGCGWSHYPPNGERDYDWRNERYVETDIEDWKPDGTGQKKRMNRDRWGGDSLRWFVFWMQSIPGAGHDLTCKGKRLTNWWQFVGDWDGAKARGTRLVEP